jgi:hypothetical protein
MQGVNGNHDERCAADLAQVAEGRGLSRGETDRLARAVTGAVRPNRDKPFWDLAHALVALAALPGPRVMDPGRAVIDIILNPGLASSEALRRKLTSDFDAGSSAVSLTADGIVLVLGETRWRTTWSGLARCLSLAEFLMTCEDLASFGVIGALIEDAISTPDADGLSRRLVQIIHGYRQAHLPAAAFERRFRAILAYMGGARQGTAVTDAAIAGFWRQEITEGERPHFRTVAEHFVTFVKLTAVLRGLANVRGAGSLEDIEGWQDRLDGMLTDVACGEEATALVAARLAQIPETPKILTGAERDDLIAVLGLDDFHQSLPLTVLRAVSFGLVQSGIANRLRRGSGGASVIERAACDDAESYTDILTRIAATQEHLRRMLKIALALRFDGGSTPNDAVAALVSAAEADIKRVRRAGFDQPREALAAAFATVDQTLAETAEEMQGFIKASGKLGGANALAGKHAEDRVFFADGLIEAYSREGSDGHRPRQPA